MSNPFIELHQNGSPFLINVTFILEVKPTDGAGASLTYDNKAWYTMTETYDQVKAMIDKVFEVPMATAVPDTKIYEWIPPKIIVVTDTYPTPIKDASDLPHNHV